ncbi:hypothetical protein FBY22_4946 [Streptomyces sp. SLBN-31]|nr:hypothetical protein FBY22_4946 [Streptomyces sp. SLBN-31]
MTGARHEPRAREQIRSRALGVAGAGRQSLVAAKSAAAPALAV